MYIFNFNSYFMFSYFFNNIYFILWSGIDAGDYLFSFIMWLALAFLSLISNFLHSYFFFNNFSNKKTPINLNKNFNFFQAYKLQKKNNTNSQLSKKDYKWVLYQWLKTTNNSAVNQQKILEILYENNTIKKNWSNNYLFFNKLYKTLNYLILIENQSSINNFIEKQNNFYLKNNSNGVFDINNYLIKFFKNKNNFNLIINFYFWNQKNKYFINLKKNDSLLFLKNNNLWHFSKIINKTSNYYNHLLNIKFNNFYLSTFNFNKLNNFNILNNSYFILNNSILEQFTNAKWNRWLYKYSILHRKTFKTSHKLTLSKKLLNNVITNKTSFLWAETFNFKFNNLNIQNMQINDVLLNSQNNNPLTNANLNLLNNYESSYFWFLKRFYFFNFLNANRISTNLFFLNSNSNVIVKNNEFNKYKLMSSYLLKVPTLFINQITYINNGKYKNFSLFNNNNKNNFFFNFNNKDIYLFNNDTFLFNKTNLFFFNWITSSNLTYFSLNFKNINNCELYTENIFNANNEFYENINSFELIFNIDNLNVLNFQNDLSLLYFFI